MESGIANATVQALVVDPQNSATIYAAYAGTFGTGGGVLKSTNSGGSWDAAGIGLDNTSVFALAIDPQEPAILYGTAFGSGVFKTTDGGENWNAINTGLANVNVWSLALNPQNPSIVYAGSFGGGVYKSTDGGASWVAANNGNPNVFVFSLAIDPQDPETIYLGGFNGGLSKSIDGGATWSTISSGLPSESIWSLAVDPASPYRIFAGTDNNGVWFDMPVCSSLTMGSGGAAACRTTGGEGTTRVGYATLSLNSGSVPYGTAVFSYQQNDVTVSEAGVPASPPTTQARIFIDYRSSVNAIPGRAQAGTVDVNTGIAAVNYGTASANVTYTLRDINGGLITSGSGIVEADSHFAKFINQFGEIASGFNLPGDYQATIQFSTLEITSDQPLSIVALRMTTNQRGEVLFTTLPVADLTRPIGNDPIYFPQFADGGGYTTSVLLLNTSGETETGTLQILDDEGVPVIVNQVGGTTDSSFNYSIPPGGAFRFQTDGFPTGAKTGWILLTPDGGSLTPVGSGVFGYNPVNALVSESGVPSAVPTTHARVYVDLSGGHNTGLAIANIQAGNISIAINAFQTDGDTAIGTSEGPLELSGSGHRAQFADQFISGLPEGFTGVLDVSASTPFAALTLRSLYNERQDFLMTAFPIADATRTAPSPIVFPQIADDGGYVTEFILLSPDGESSATLNLFDESGDSIP